MKGTSGGEIVQVQGGHVLRATGRKDRHSKVFTAKGPRDRRVRLAAHTAIQFYDVQDRLGYDRPSKAVDWLIKKAKKAIDKLAELPPWNPNDDTVALNAEPDLGSSSMALEQSSSMGLEQRSEGSSGYVFQLQKQMDGDQIGNSSFIQPSNETQCIADSMKLFFPTSSGTSLMNFQNYPHDVMSRETDDLGLSLHTMQEPNRNHKASADQAHFSGSDPLPYDSNYTKTAGWGGNANGENRMGFVFTPQALSQQHPFFCQTSTIPRRESLQSNYSHLIYAWNNRSLPTGDHHNAEANNQLSVSSSHFGEEFQVPARLQGEEEPGVFSLGPSSSSPISHY